MRRQSEPDNTHSAGDPDGVKTRSPKLWQWLSLRLSGLLLITFVAIHLWALHYEEIPSSSFQEIAAKLRSPGFVFLDLALLVLALYHGLLGFFRVVSDLGFLGPKGEKLLGMTLSLAGVAGLLLGYQILKAFLE